MRFHHRPVIQVLSISINKNSGADISNYVDSDKQSVLSTAPTNKSKSHNNHFIFDKNNRKKLKRDYADVLNNWINAENCGHAVDWISDKVLLNKLQVANSSSTG